tara:strand:+ start:299 stop:463 length:165 start_codon:yes stop_codon:yes gene_type:complete
MSYRKTSEALEGKVKWGWLGPYKDTSAKVKAMKKWAKDLPKAPPNWKTKKKGKK